jgi:hypothetical protein
VSGRGWKGQMPCLIGYRWILRVIALKLR